MKVYATHIVAFAFALSACGQKSQEAETPAPPPSAEPAPLQKDTAATAVVGAELPPVPPNAKVTFVAPPDGAVVEGPLENGKIAVSVKMTAEGIATKPAGPVEAGSGHHHILIDADPIPSGMVVPMDDTHLHYGKAQTEATLALAPGPHALSLQFADGIHRSYGPQLAATIKITTIPVGTAEKQAKSTAVERGEAKKQKRAQKKEKH